MDPLAAALIGAQSSGPVRMVRGRVDADRKTIKVAGGKITRYRRVGDVPLVGDRVVVLLSASTTPVVLTGVSVVA